jgi:hypothetical protein
MHDLATLLGPTRTASELALSSRATSRSIRRWLAAGRLVRLHPGWVTLPEFADDWTVRAHAATGYTGGLLSHMSALAVHGVVDTEVSRLDVTVPVVHRIESSRWLRIHRSHRPCRVTTARGLGATDVARALVDTWGDAHRSRALRGYDDVARNAVLRATRDRRVAVVQIEAELTAVPRLPARGRLLELLGHVRAGAQSHLEILGVRALVAAGLPMPLLQYGIALPDGPVRLDAAWPDVKVAVEFDGAAFHGSPNARQRDLRRDAALAALGWVVLRFSTRTSPSDRTCAWPRSPRPIECDASMPLTRTFRRLECPPQRHRRRAKDPGAAGEAGPQRWPRSRAMASRRATRSGIGG